MSKYIDICAVCEEITEELFSFDGNITFCRKCAKIGIEEGQTPHEHIYRYENNKFVKFEIKNL